MTAHVTAYGTDVMGCGRSPAESRTAKTPVKRGVLNAGGSRRNTVNQNVNWLFEPGVPNELVEDIYMHTLPLAIFAAIQGAPKARVTWPHDDEIAARVVTAAAAPKGGVQ